MKMDIVMIIRIIGFLLILFATFVATVQLPKISGKIDKIDSRISNFKDSRIMTTLCTLSYGEQFTRRRIELFEANEIVARGNNESAVADLRKRALDQTIELAKQWAVLLSGDQKEQNTKDIENQINDIVTDNNKSLSVQIDEVEKVWRIQQKEASERVAKAHENWHSIELTKSKIEDAKQIWNSVFIWCQILGLITLSLAEILDKFVKKNI